MTDNKFIWALKSRKVWASVLSMLVALGVLTFSDAEQAEMVGAIVGGIGAVYTIAVALEDGLTKHNANTTTVTTPSENVQIRTSDTGTPPHVGPMGLK